MINKRSGLIFSSILSTIGLTSLVSAAFDTRTITQSVINFYKDFFGPIFAALFGQYSTDEFLFAKILIFLLLVVIIHFILKKSKFLGDRTFLIILISVVVSLLAMRFLPDNDLINGILLPYGALGIALVTFLPFLIYFYFVHNSLEGGFARRSAWAVYAIVFVVLLGFRWDQISPVSEWIYIISMIVIVLAFIFDTRIHSYFALREISKWSDSFGRRNKNSIKIRLADLSRIPNPDSGTKKEIEELEKHLASFD